MVRRKSAVAGSSNASISAAPAQSTAVTTTKSAQTSSILRSAFAPSHFQLHLFASVIQSFDSQHLRLHDTNSGRLRSQHSTKPGSRITCLDWGFYGTDPKQDSQSSSKKKRRRTNNDNESVVIAYGTSSSEICMFSPAEGKVIGTLVGGHEKGIRDFRFSSHNPSEAWSLGEDSHLVQWDLIASKPTRTIPLPDQATSVLALPSFGFPQILCASSAPSTIELATSDDFRIQSFDSFKNPVRVLFRSPNEQDETTKYFLAADSDRYINLYDMALKQIVRTLITASGVDRADISTSSSDPKSLLAVVTVDGIVELFIQPFQQATIANGELSSKRKNLTRKSSAQIKLVGTQAKKSLIPVFSASIQGNDIVLATTHGGVDVSFHKVPCLDEDTGELMFDGLREVPTVNSASSLQNVNMNGVKDLGKLSVDESRAVVTSGGQGAVEASTAIEISSSDEESVEDESQDEDMPDADATGESADESENEESDSEESIHENGEADTAMIVAQDDTRQDVEETEEPSFGQLLAARHPDTIAIIDNADQDLTALTKSDGTNLTLGSGISLGTVLTQALRTNDRSLLESCLHITNEDIVRNTIQRLESSLAGILLSKLAERLASRPGRTGPLLTWVRWTCIAHGSVIATQPEVASKIRTLYRVLGDRSRTLDNLLLLKGKLDMLDAQLTYRQRLQAQRANAGNKNDPNEPGMIVIEGEADQWSSEDEYDEAVGQAQISKSKTKRKALKALPSVGLSDQSSSEEDNDDDDKPMINGVKDQDSSSDEEEDDTSEDEISHKKRNHIIDDEAEESAQDESDLEEEDEGSDNDSASSGSSEDEEEEEEEYDSDMDSFINDGSISEVEDQEGINLDDDVETDDEEVDQTPQKPKSKKSKLR